VYDDRIIALLQSFNEGPVLADGAFGSLFGLRYGDERSSMAPLERPEETLRIHRDYLAAGARVVKTATFASSGAELGERAYEANHEAALLAKRAAAEAEASDGAIRWVAGSVGPGTGAPSLGGPSPRALIDAYAPQMGGLVEGGVDFVLLETSQDPLQCKAAIRALRNACAESGRDVPFVASATVDTSGRMLTGTPIGTFAAIIAPLGPLAIGVNCSGGPRELDGPLSALREGYPAALSYMPNAGLPTKRGSLVEWPMDPGDFGALVARQALERGAALVGGCCGTTPEHIAALAAELSRLRGAAARIAAAGYGAARARFAIASNLATYKAGEGLLWIDERCNASGGAAFARALAAANGSRQAAAYALSRAEGDVAAIDLALARRGSSGADEADALEALVREIAPSARAAVSLDSARVEPIERALAHIGGRPLLNSVNLEDEDAAMERFALAREHGAAVVCLCLDGSGPAKDAEGKLEVARRLRRKALEAGLRDEDLAFDPCTFPLVGDGGPALARATLEAIAAIKAAFPSAATLIGAGNCSYGLPRSIRPFVTARFISRAMERGLDAAIADPALRTIEVPTGIASAVDALIDGDPGAIDRLLESADGGKGELEKPGKTGSDLDPLERAVLSGDSAAAAEAVKAETGPRAATAERIANAMALVGAAYERGERALPSVLRCSDAARAAFDAAFPGGSPGDAGTVVLATVRGDIHDIGKNLVAMVLAASGYRVVDLGTDRDAADIAEAAREARANAVGVSGLLSKSLDRMREVAIAMRDAGLAIPLLVGGAAATARFAEEELTPIAPVGAFWGKDPFHALSILRSCRATDASAPAPSTAGSRRGPQGTNGAAAPSMSRVIPYACGESFAPPWLGTREIALPPFTELVDASIDDARRRFTAGGSGGEGLEAFEETARALYRQGITPRAALGFFETTKRGDALSLEGPDATAEFRFPREREGRLRAVTDWLADRDAVAAFVATLGAAAAEFASEAARSGSAERLWAAHVLLAAAAEEAAARAHALAAAYAIAGGASRSGKRFSFGFPGCPAADANIGLLSLLDAEAIGVRALEGGEMSPEFSVSAIVIARPGVEYFDPDR
jgi:5-methyltetrahydrofolate--homocysteine methyltransferase